MGHKPLINGTAYEITGGKTLINGTAYSISKGRTLIDGTGYDVGFGVEPLIIYDGGQTIENGEISHQGNSCTITDGKIQFTSMSFVTDGQLLSIGGINLTKYKTLNFIGYKSRNLPSQYTFKAGYSDSANGSTTFTQSQNITATTLYNVNTVSFDITSVTGTDWYIKMALTSTTGAQTSGYYAYITKIWLE